MPDVRDEQHRVRKRMQCSICKGPIDVEPITGWDGGHNAWPINDGRCCSDCNSTIVIQARLARIYNKPKGAPHA